MADPYLQKLCSDSTLFSPKDGFFSQWADQVEQLLGEKFVQKFGNIKTDEKRIMALWDQECVHSLNIQSFRTLKNAEVAETKRIEGNKAFQVGDHNKALQIYSQAVIRSPYNAEDISLSLANRSAVLLHSKFYDLCLQDISLALERGYPKRLRYKIMDRKGQCLAKLGLKEEAKKAFETALEEVKKSDLDQTKRETFVDEVETKIEDLSTSLPEDKGKCDQQDIYQEQLFKGKSKILPKASSALYLEYSKDTGRYMGASEDIPAGKILVRENPFGSVLMQEKRGSFCEHCFKKLIAPIPCDSCSGVTFCSVECQETALRTYHKWECPYLNLFKASGMSLNCFLALRIITERGLKYYKKLSVQDLGSGMEIPSNASVHRPEEYRSFYNLVALEEERSTQDFLKRTLMAVFLLKVLQHAGFFGKQKSQEDLREDEAKIGSLILRHLQVIQFNAHEVSGIAYEGEKSYKNCKSIYIGLAVYPTVSYFNHSCYPAVGRYFNGKEMTIVNLRPLAKGAAVPENYGPIFTHSPREERQKKLLSRYWFRCKCEACEGNWPTYDNMSNEIVLLKQENPSKVETNETKKKKRNRRRKKANNPSTSENNKESESTSKEVETYQKETLSPSDAYKAFELGKTFMDTFRREDAIAAYEKWVEAVANKVHLPLKDYHLALEALRLLVFTRGNYYTVNK